MKKWMILLAGTLLASSVLVACGQKKDQPTSPSSSSKVSSTSTSSASSKKSETRKNSTELSTEASSSDTSISSSQENSQEPSEPATKESSAKSESKEEREPAATSSLDMQAIDSGDFSSMAGTWRDANGVTFIHLMPRDLYQMLPSWSWFTLVWMKMEFIAQIFVGIILQVLPCLLFQQGKSCQQERLLAGRIRLTAVEIASSLPKVSQSTQTFFTV